MKKHLASQEGIGSIINRFEASEVQTIETFNEFFPACRLTGYNLNATVTIGDYNRGRRRVLIDDTISLEHEFSLIDLTLCMSRLSPFLLKYPDGELIGRFNTILEASDFLDIVYSTFRNKLAKLEFIVEELPNE